MEQYIIGLFTNISLLTAILIGAGVLLCIVEVFVPKIGLTGILGCSLVVLGFASYYMDGFKVKQIVSLLLIVAFVIALFIMIELILESKGIIKNPDRYKFRAIGIQHSLDGLIGGVGKAYTSINKSGTIDIDGKLYYAVSNDPIIKGSDVHIVGAGNNYLIVVKK
jgi:membrane-bound ClpP family serine protease